MTTPLLATKLYIPPVRSNIVLRPRLTGRLNEGQARKLTLISAPAGFGKTTLLNEWLAQCGRPAAWLSLDDRDNDPARFLAYLVAATQTIAPNVGKQVMSALQSPQAPPIESVLTALLNDIAASVTNDFTLVLDDYHTIDSKPIDHALSFLLDHLPLRMRVVVATREDPQLPLARMRAGNQLTELRVADLRFTPAEAAQFLNQTMGLNLAADDIAALEARTEGWIAGLQLAAISIQGQPDSASFIRSFTGGHHFVMDYLVEEVLQQQPARIQTFLLRTSILDRLCGPLCDAVLRDAAASGQATLEYLERANLFIVPLDNERRWYRYHHLFADLLRQRLRQHIATDGASEAGDAPSVAELHQRASGWYEAQGLEIEAFQHATAANDIERAERLIEGNGMPLHFRGVVMPVMNWIASLPNAVLDAHPSLRMAYSSVLLVTGQTTGVEQQLQAAERSLENAEPNDTTRDLIGRIAAIRATAAINLLQVDAIIAHSQRALEYLAPTNLAFRTSTAWKLGLAYQLQGDRVAARQTYTDVIAIGQSSGNMVYVLLASTGLGMLQEGDNQLPAAAQTYQRIIELAGEPPLPFACEAYAGMARVCYEWNQLDEAERYGRQGRQLAQQIESADRFVGCELLLARLKLAQGDTTGALTMLAEAERLARQQHLVDRAREVAAAQVVALLRQGHLAPAAQLAQTHELPISRARVALAQGDAPAALATLAAYRQQMEAKDWKDELLKAALLQAIAFQAHADNDAALRALGDALALAEPGGIIRSFVDEGAPIARLLALAAARGLAPDYIARLLSAFDAETQHSEAPTPRPGAMSAQPLIEPLSQRELEILDLIAQGLSNHEISVRLFLALDTVKGHNRRIFGKLQVQRRTEAVAKARALNLLPHTN